MFSISIKICGKKVSPGLFHMENNNVFYRKRRFSNGHKNSFIAPIDLTFCSLAQLSVENANLKSIFFRGIYLKCWHWQPDFENTMTVKRYQDKIPPDKTPPDKIPRTKSPWTKSPQDKIPLDKIPPSIFYILLTVIYFINSSKWVSKDRVLCQYNLSWDVSGKRIRLSFFNQCID